MADLIGHHLKKFPTTEGTVEFDLVKWQMRAANGDLWSMDVPEVMQLFEAMSGLEEGKHDHH